MLDLGIPNDHMGARDPERYREHHVFFPGDQTGGSVSPAGQITLDSGLMNPDLLAVGYDEPAQKTWRRAGIRDRSAAIIPHELAENESDGDHELALIAGPETKLPISHAARELLRQMAVGFHLVFFL